MPTKLDILMITILAPIGAGLFGVALYAALYFSQLIHDLLT
jgi:hypothetical protein